MEIEKIINKIKNHENSDSVGMIASHLGIVRSFSRNGKDVEAVNVKYDTSAPNFTETMPVRYNIDSSH